MAVNFSFDIVSEIDLQEVDNAVNQAKKELSPRFDFRGSKSSIDYNREEKKITLRRGRWNGCRGMAYLLSGK